MGEVVDLAKRRLEKQREQAATTDAVKITNEARNAYQGGRYCPNCNITYSGGWMHRCYKAPA